MDDSKANPLSPSSAKWCVQGVGDGELTANTSLLTKEEYKKVLFTKLTPAEEKKMHWLMVKYWAICWAAIVGRAMGLYGNWLLLPVVALCVLLHVVAAHDCNHLRTPLPAPFRIVGYGIFCSGFLPLAPVYGDIEYQHLHVHHVETKAVIDHEDSHSRLARMSFPLMVLSVLVQPGHISFEDVLFHQICKNKSSFSLWSERFVTNAFHWAQLAVLWKLGTFWPVLIAGHISMFILWLFFNGLLHYPPFYRFLVRIDKSGMRYVPVLEPIMKVVSINAWLEIKWHDVHHALVSAVTTFGAQMARGMTYEQIDTACANMVDEGLFLDANGKPVSPLAMVGHELGSRRAYLQHKVDCPLLISA